MEQGGWRRSERKAGFLGSACCQNGLFPGVLARPAAPWVHLHSELYLKGNTMTGFHNSYESFIVGDVL